MTPERKLELEKTIMAAKLMGKDPFFPGFIYLLDCQCEYCTIHREIKEVLEERNGIS